MIARLRSAVLPAVAVVVFAVLVRAAIRAAVIAGTLGYTSAGNYTVTVKVSDGALSATRSFTWTVTNVNRPPTLAAVSAQSFSEGALVALSLIAADPDGDALVYSVTGLPPGLGIDAATGFVSGTLTYSSAGSYTVSVTVTDGSLTASQAFPWTVANVNRPPVFAAPTAQTHAEHTTVSVPSLASAATLNSG